MENVWHTLNYIAKVRNSDNDIFNLIRTFLQSEK